jgi:D-alanyl-D-alanine dipeptidase
MHEPGLVTERNTRRQRPGPKRLRGLLCIAAIHGALLLPGCGSSNPEPVSPTAGFDAAVEAGDAERPEAADDAQDAAAQSALLPALSAGARQVLDSVSSLIAVRTPAWSDPSAKLALFRRNGGSWTLQRGPWDAQVGSKGLSWGRGLTLPPPGAARVKLEGDKTAPAGLFRLGEVMGYSAEPPAGLKLPYRQATADIICVDDPNSAHYNRVVDLGSGTAPDWNSYESMRRSDNLYSLLALIDHNGLTGAATPVKGGGSCIFMHLWSGPGSPTIGCTALEGSRLTELLIDLDTLEQTVLVQLPAAEYADGVLFWQLPAMP